MEVFHLIYSNLMIIHIWVGVSTGLKIECGEWNKAALLISEISREIDANPTCSIDNTPIDN